MRRGVPAVHAVAPYFRDDPGVDMTSDLRLRGNYWKHLSKHA